MEQEDPIVGPDEAALIVAPDGEVRLVLPEGNEVNDRVALLALVAARFEDPQWVAVMLVEYREGRSDALGCRVHRHRREGLAPP